MGNNNKWHVSNKPTTNQQPTTHYQQPSTQYPVPSDQRPGTMNHVATTRSTSVTVGTRTNYTRYARGRANTNTNTNTTTMKYNNNNNKTPRIAKNATALAAGVTVLGTTLVAQNAHAASEVFQVAYNLSDSQVFGATFISLIAGILATKLGSELYK